MGSEGPTKINVLLTVITLVIITVVIHTVIVTIGIFDFRFPITNISITIVSLIILESWPAFKLKLYTSLDIDV